jgi:hypothetical protein
LAGIVRFAFTSTLESQALSDKVAKAAAASAAGMIGLMDLL